MTGESRHEFADRVFDAGATDCCQIWPFGVSDGYVTLMLDSGIRVRLHAYICEKQNGPRPPDHDAAHTCGHKRCFNRGHLVWKTRQANLADRAAHGTLRRGDNYPNTKYPDALVSQLTTRYWDWVQQTASELQIPKGHAHRILRGASRQTGDSHGA